MVKNLLAFIGSIIMMLVGTFINGWFIMLLWNWFIPSIIGLAPLTYACACGLSILITYFFTPRTKLIKEELKLTGRLNGKGFEYQTIDLEGAKSLATEEIGAALGRWIGFIMTNMFIVFVGWLIHLMM